MSSMTSSKKVEKVNMCVKGLKKIKITVYANQKTGSYPFKIDGEFPAHISSINESDVSMNAIDLKQGDFLIKINGQNVSRASAKSVRKIIKGSSQVKMTVYRQQKASKPFKKSQNFASPTNYELTARKNVLSCFAKIMKKKSRIQSTYELNENIKTDSDSDYGYFSIPHTDDSCLNEKFHTAKSNSDNEETMSYTCVSNRHDDAKTILSDIKTIIMQFLIDIESLIEIYVRPTIALNLLNKQEYLNLYQNLEKLVPVAKYMLNHIDSVFSENSEFLNFSMLLIVFESYETYLNGLPNAMELLTLLMLHNKSFDLFQKTVGRDCSMKIREFLLMPFGFLKGITSNLIKYYNLIRLRYRTEAEEALEILNNYLYGYQSNFELYYHYF